MLKIRVYFTDKDVRGEGIKTLVIDVDEYPEVVFWKYHAFRKFSINEYREVLWENARQIEPEDTFQ